MEKLLIRDKSATLVVKKNKKIKKLYVEKKQIFEKVFETIFYL
jgi:hypothetical protein